MITIEVGALATEYDATDVKTPVLVFMLSDWMAELDWFPTNRYLPLGSRAMEFGCAAVLNFELDARVSEPSLPMEYARRFPADSLLTTYMYFPEFSMSKATGPFPVSPIGEPDNGARDPSGLIVNSDIELSSLFAVYRNFPPESMVSPAGLFPVA